MQVAWVEDALPTLTKMAVQKKTVGKAGAMTKYFLKYVVEKQKAVIDLWHLYGYRQNNL